MPATTGHSSQNLNQGYSNENVLENETKRGVAIPHIGSAPKPIERVPSQIWIRKG